MTGIILLALATTASPQIEELAVLLYCGSIEYPTMTCCKAAKDARKTADPEGRLMIDTYLNKNCRQWKGK